MGGLKLENTIIEGQFYAPKFYTLKSENEKTIFKLKGVMDQEKGFSQIKEDTQSFKIVNEGTFLRKWDSVIITDQEKEFRLDNNKRKWLGKQKSFPFKNYEDYLNSK